MKREKKILLYLVLLGLTVTKLSAQILSPEIITCNGDQFSTDDIIIDWTVGESICETEKTSDNIITQGFQQNSNILKVVNDTNSKCSIIAYPNPTSDIVFIKINGMTNIIVEVTDIQGKSLSNYKITDMSNIQIDFAGFEEGQYYIKIYDVNNAYLKIITIQKKSIK